MVTILRFASYAVSAAPTHLHCVRADADSMQANECGCGPVKLYLWTLIGISYHFCAS